MVNYLINKWPEYFQPGITSKKKRIISFLLAFFLTFITYQTILEIVTVEIPIFGFHDIVNLQNPQEIPPQRRDSPGDYSQQNLEPFLEDLVIHNYWFLSTQELYEYFIANPKKPIPSEYRGRKKVMISFDDGNESIYTHVLPILQRLENKYGKKTKVVVFINSGFLGHQDSLIKKVTCQNLRDGMQQGYYDIQSHGLNHENLTKISLKALDRELSQDQIRLRKCTQDLDQNRTVASHIAYPFGAVNKQVEKYVAQYFTSGYLYNSLKLKLRFFPANQYRISRLTVNKKHSTKRLSGLASGSWLHKLIGK
ncbi:polysaccharide deacetylase family protein [Tychonema sp. LEGE 07199]|uniref:polysaccharide deacetylase family protein n=1 Tax=unclassified Tychonema TaxID=2642144 RepID=UPI001881CF17|nr:MULTISPECIES: polysaccharide deacetylase family protein [unclassified Tychonema]MBE9120626.1 polysaccharide deacetylase family protein [Tychonema sp. LEGE 07199]MBE9131988.1 polysaccharide deacetylase family protein [Tychonema sp. LEGE 07196]